MDSISLQEIARNFQIENLTPTLSLDECYIDTTELNRPALQLTGYFSHFEKRRIQIAGNVEMAYLGQFSEEEQDRRYEGLFSRGIPVLIFTRGNLPPDSVIALAVRYHIPLLSTNMASSAFQARLMRFLEVRLAPMTAIHGELVDVFGEGVLLLGESGIGKSEVALELIKRGHRLVADDTVEIRRISEYELIGRSPEVTRYLMELRGIGIIDVKALYGVERVMEEMRISMVIRLLDWDRNRTFDRLGMKEETVEYLGAKLPCYSVPISPGRNVAIIVETASVNFRQKRMGYDAMQELRRRLNQKMNGGEESPKPREAEKPE